jgi:hypothetical protein
MLDNVHRDEAGVDIAKVRGLDWGSRIDIRGNY